MMGITHTALSVSGAILITGSLSPWVFIAAGIGSQIPDMDTTESWIGRAVYPLAKFLEDRFPHRSLTHSFFLTIAIAVFTSPLLFRFDWRIWAAMPIGHVISCFADTFTKSGCQFFYPANRDIWVLGLNPKNRITTKSTAEYSILGSAVIVLCIACYLYSGNGGLSAYVNRTIFPTSRTAVELLRQESGKAIRVRVTGTKQADNSNIDALYWGIGSKGYNLIVESDRKVYRVGSDGEIIPNKVEVQEARKSIRTRRMRIEEAEGLEWVRSLPDNAFISGKLEIEDAGEIELPISPPGAFTTITKSASGVNLEYSQRSELAPIEEFFILSGEVIVYEM
jgi:inner membrane protein